MSPCCLRQGFQRKLSCGCWLKRVRWLARTRTAFSGILRADAYRLTRCGLLSERNNGMSRQRLRLRIRTLVTYGYGLPSMPIPSSSPAGRSGAATLRLQLRLCLIWRRVSANRVQITSDGHKPYIEAIEKAFGSDVDFSILQKIHGSPLENETRHSSATCIGIDVRHVTGNPDPKHVSTPYVERQNLSVRMSLRRYTRLTNAFSRKLENHAAAVALYYFSYNLIKIHGTLRCTPAMAVA